MQKVKLPAVSWAQLQGKLVAKIPWKTLAKITAVALLLQFSDVLLPLLGEGLHLVIEFIESGLERVLEHGFGLSPRKAQMVLAYSAFFLVLYLLYLLLRKIRVLLLDWNRVALARWQIFKMELRHGKYWLHIAAVVSVCGVYLFFFL